MEALTSVGVLNERDYLDISDSSNVKQPVQVVKQQVGGVLVILRVTRSGSEWI